MTPITIFMIGFCLGGIAGLAFGLIIFWEFIIDTLKLIAEGKVRC